MVGTERRGAAPAGVGPRGTMDSWEMHDMFLCGYLMQ